MKPEEIEKMQQRQFYPNFWHVELLPSMSTDPGYCCFALWCPCCASYQLRRRALYGDMSRYVCCGGYMPCSGKFKEKSCPEFCLATEASLCFVSSVLSTRWMLQDEFRLQTTKCDNCLVGTMFVIQQLACICSLIACIAGSDDLNDLAECLRCLADMITCTVTTWMMTQQKIEMDKRDGMILGEPVMGVPPVQQMSRDVPTLPHPINGIPAQTAPYGYPPPGISPTFYPPGPHPGPYPPPTFGPEPHHSYNPSLPPTHFNRGPQYGAPNSYPDPHIASNPSAPPSPGLEQGHNPPGPAIQPVLAPGNPLTPQKMT